MLISKEYKYFCQIFFQINSKKESISLLNKIIVKTMNFYKLTLKIYIKKILILDGDKLLTKNSQK